MQGLSLVSESRMPFDDVADTDCQGLDRSPYRHSSRLVLVDDGTVLYMGDAVLPLRVTWILFSE